MKDPSPDQIKEALSKLAVRASGYAILAGQDREFIQTACTEPGNFILEWHDPESDTHVSARENDITLSSIQEVFVSFREGDSQWKHNFAWQKIEGPGSNKNSTKKHWLDYASIACSSIGVALLVILIVQFRNRIESPTWLLALLLYLFVPFAVNTIRRARQTHPWRQSARLHPYTNRRDINPWWDLNWEKRYIVVAWIILLFALMLPILWLASLVRR